MTAGQLMVSVLLLGYIAFRFDIQSLNVLNSVSRYEWFLLSVFIVIVPMPFVAAIRWKILLFHSGIVEDTLSLIQITYISIFWGFVIPSATGYDVIRIYQMEKRHKSKTGVPGGTVIAERYLGFLLLCALGILGTLIAPNFSEIRAIRLTLLGIILFLLIAFWAVSRSITTNLLSALMGEVIIINKAIHYFLKVREAFTLIPIRVVLLKVLPLMLCYQLAQLTLIFLLFKSMGCDIPFYHHLALAPIVQIITVIPISFSGVGVRESAFIHFYNFIGIHPVTSFYVSIVYYLITMGISFLIGGIWSIVQNIKKIDIIQEDRQTR